MIHKEKYIGKNEEEEEGNIFQSVRGMLKPLFSVESLWLRHSNALLMLSQPAGVESHPPECHQTSQLQGVEAVF